MSDRILAKIRQATGEVRGRRLGNSEIESALGSVEAVLLDEIAELVALPDDELFGLYSRAIAPIIPSAPNFDYVSRINAFICRVKGDRPIPEHVAAACEEGGYTEPFQNDGQVVGFSA